MRRARGYKAGAASGTSAAHPEPGPRRSEEILKYRGEPNGLKIHRDGRIFIADHEQGLLILDPASGTTRVALDRPYAERFKGLNDLLFARNGDCYFTDQGESDQRDPTGRLFRLRASGELDCLLDNVPSPNGLVLTPDESILYLAVTRGNAIWRVPLAALGGLTVGRLGLGRVGIWVQMSGGGGPEMKTLYITEADSGTVQLAELDVPGLPLFSHQG